MHCQASHVDADKGKSTDLSQIFGCVLGRLDVEVLAVWNDDTFETHTRHVPRFCVPARAAGLATFICGKIRCCALAGRNLSRMLIVAESVGPLFFYSKEITLAA